MKTIIRLFVVAIIAFTFSACSGTGKFVTEPVTIPVPVPVEVVEEVVIEEIKPVVVAAPVEVKATRIIILENIMFPFDESIIMDSEQTTVDKLASLLKEYPDTQIAIIGYACSVGSDEYNETLSKERADSVKNALVGHDIDADRMVSVGEGEVNSFGDELKLNRRSIVRSIE